ncbi:MAG: hypothetical protein AAFX85_14580 [Pseudomonadota bacterium]
MSAGRRRTALASAALYGSTALMASAAAAWLSPLLAPDLGRWVGAGVFAVASAWFGLSYGSRYVTTHPGRDRTPLWICLYASIVTAVLWGYGYAWFVDPVVTRLSIMAPFVGLIRGIHFTGLLLLSASPLLMPAWWASHRVLQRFAERIYVSAL